MTIGPEPITSTELRSVRLGILLVSSCGGVCRGGAEVDEPVEQVGGVVGSGRGLGVELRAEGWQVQAAQTFDDVVVEAVVTDLDPAVVRFWGVEGLPRRGGDGEAVVLAGDLDSAGGVVHHRLIDAAVAEGQLVGVETQGSAE